MEKHLSLASSDACPVWLVSIPSSNKGPRRRGPHSDLTLPRTLQLLSATLYLVSSPEAPSLLFFPRLTPASTAPTARATAATAPMTMPATSPPLRSSPASSSDSWSASSPPTPNAVNETVSEMVVALAREKPSTCPPATRTSSTRADSKRCRKLDAGPRSSASRKAASMFSLMVEAKSCDVSIPASKASSSNTSRVDVYSATTSRRRRRATGRRRRLGEVLG
mmetsp:Transcript_1555/g.6785  ORF Transcript_1555/g.6785 Transcript_1555/m.6785 type:complete len:222 (+) Transcript_1555:374-1039(+)